MDNNNALNSKKIAVVGLGYVGLPLAALFASKYPTIGFDTKAARVDEINAGNDSSEELSNVKLARAIANGFVATTDAAALDDCNIMIVAVPTPVDKDNLPLLTPIEGATKTVGAHLRPGDIVVYESTVYPGLTEEICVPLLEQTSGLRFNVDFFVGYSPERINPGDHEHTVENICKITSGSTPEVAEIIDSLYNSVLKNGTFRASSIKVAEAAKIIENSQRDVNIAFVNEISKIFNLIGIDTQEVLKAAGSKWNFLDFKPGLVGGHCIGVDPYYLIQRAEDLGMHPRLMSAARAINDTMSQFMAQQIADSLLRRGIILHQASILVLGFTFKANCRDTRNTKVADVVNSLKAYTPFVDVYDPWVDVESVKAEYDADVLTDFAAINSKKYDAIAYCVDHLDFHEIDLDSMLKPTGFVYYVYDPHCHALPSQKRHAF